MARKKSAAVLKENKGASNALHLTDTTPSAIKIAYIGGGSRGWAHALMKDLAACHHLNGEVRLYDIDHDLAAFNAKYANWLQTHPNAVSSWKYSAVKSLKAALQGADFVFLSIQPGPIGMMKVDLEEPEKHGIYQAVGDTVGPGGLVRSLRTIPTYRKFAQAIAEHAPNAWCFNFTNPMTVCTRTLHREVPGIKAFGCCHEVFGTQNKLGDIYQLMTKREKPGRADVRVNVLGVNHFTWVDKAEINGTDMIRLLQKYVQRPGVIKKFRKPRASKTDSVFGSKWQVALELFRRFGVIGAAGDRHLAEFVPWFITDKNSCYYWGFRLTPYSFRINRYRNAPKQFRKELQSKAYPKLSDSGEEYIHQMLALLGKTTLRTNVNLPNSGQMGDTPRNVVVETNAIFSQNSVEPVASGTLPAPVNTLVQRHITNQETIIQAAWEKDRDLAFQAFINDPLVHLPVDDAWKLFTTMLKKTGNPV